MYHHVHWEKRWSSPLFFWCFLRPFFDVAPQNFFVDCIIANAESCERLAGLVQVVLLFPRVRQAFSDLEIWCFVPVHSSNRFAHWTGENTGKRCTGKRSALTDQLTLLFFCLWKQDCFGASTPPFPWASSAFFGGWGTIKIGLKGVLVLLRVLEHRRPIDDFKNFSRVTHWVF